MSFEFRRSLPVLRSVPRSRASARASARELAERLHAAWVDLRARRREAAEWASLRAFDRERLLADAWIERRLVR